MEFGLKAYINSITNLSTARYAAGMQVKYLGFNADEKNDSFLDLDSIKEILSWVTGFDAVCDLGNQGISLHTEPYINSGFEIFATQNPEVIKYCINKGFKIVLNLETKSSIDERLDLIIEKPNHFAFLQLSPELYIQYHDLLKKHEIFINYNKPATQLQEFLKIYPDNIGLSISGSKEKQVGMPDIDYLADVLENLDAIS